MNAMNCRLCGEAAPLEIQNSLIANEKKQASIVCPSCHGKAENFLKIIMPTFQEDNETVNALKTFSAKRDAALPISPDLDKGCLIFIIIILRRAVAAQFKSVDDLREFLEGIPFAFEAYLSSRSLSEAVEELIVNMNQ